MIIQLIIPVLWGMDILLTYIFVYFYRAKYPRDKDWKELEINPLVKFFWSKFGLHKGTTFKVLIIDIPLVLLIIILTFKSEFILGSVFGIYAITLFIHYANFINFFKK